MTDILQFFRQANIIYYDQSCLNMNKIRDILLSSIYDGVRFVSYIVHLRKSKVPDRGAGMGDEQLGLEQ